MIPHKISLICALVLMMGCAVPKRGRPAIAETDSPAAVTTQVWRKRSYQVRFAAGPVRWLPEDGGHKGFSTYSVAYQERDKPLRTEVGGSAMDIDVLVHCPNLNLSECIEMWASPSERWLLIKENVPNDCAPCANYLLFERQEEKLAVTYLKMPTWQPQVKTLKNEVLPPVFAEHADILELTEDAVEFCFSDKQRRRIPLRDIPRAAGPVFPG